MSKEERSFLLWAQRMRNDYRQHVNKNVSAHNSLDRNRIRKLDEIGFEWKDPGSSENRRPGHRGKVKNEVVFDERIDALRQIKATYGDINDMNNLEKAGHPKHSVLYNWLRAQRKNWRALQKGKWSSLTPERIAKLQSLDVNFHPRKHYAPAGSKKHLRRDRRRTAAGGTGDAAQADNGNVGGENATTEEADQQGLDEDDEDEDDESGSSEEETEEEEEAPPAAAAAASDYERYRAAVPVHERAAAHGYERYRL